jgi:hypothetical protein
LPRVDMPKRTGVRCLPRGGTKFFDDTDYPQERTLTTKSTTLFRFVWAARDLRHLVDDGIFIFGDGVALHERVDGDEVDAR